MKPLSSIEIKLCQTQAKIFEESVNKTAYSSLIFIRRFMFSSISQSLDNQLYLFRSESIDDVFTILDHEFGHSDYGKIKYTQDQMFWIGYIYRCLSIKYNLSSKTVYKLFKANEIIKYYNMGHTFDIVDAAERMMESIHYDTSTIEEKAYNCMKNLMYLEKLMSYLGQSVTINIKNSKNYEHQNYYYGDINAIKNLDKTHQGAYILGLDKPLDTFNGKVLAILNKVNNANCILIVCEKDKNYTKDEIIKIFNFQEKNIKRKIIMNNYKKS